jgi:hypothetical protein
MAIESRRVDQAYVTAVATYKGHTEDLGVFNGFDGGGATADSSKIRRGGTRTRKSLGGVPDIDDVTITRDYDLARDHTMIHWLYSGVGTADMTVSWWPTDDDDRPFGQPVIYTGKLIGSTKPGLDMDSSDPSVLELVISCDSPVSGG